MGESKYKSGKAKNQCFAAQNYDLSVTLGFK